MQKYLAVDSDIKFAERENAVWLEKRGIGMERVDTMTEAIHLLLIKPPAEYLYVGINSDAVDCIPLLSTMREVTAIPILIATNSFTSEKEAVAMSNGATFYGRYHPTTEENITSVMTWVDQATRKTEQKPLSRNVLAYKDLIVSVPQYSVFIGNRKADLTRHEFDLLHTLMENRGIVLTYEQIYSDVWKDEHDDAANEVVRSAIKRLRKKLGGDDAESRYIENVRDVGYRIAADFL